MVKKTLTEILVLLFLVTPFVYAAESSPTTLVIPPGKWWSMPEMAKKINLTEPEKKKLDDLYIVFYRKLIDRRAVMEKLWLDIDTLFDREEFNESAVLEQFKKHEAERSAIATDRFQFLVDVRKILGRERYQRLKALYKELSKK
jgi:Spy/CpxP family protein refolding chaperone